MAGQGLLEASGVVLGREKMGEGGLWLRLFLKGQGTLRASAPGAELGRVRFGGGTEPFVWGTFHLHRGRSGGLCLNSVDIADDMLGLRTRPEALRTAVRWSGLVARFLPQDYPEDGLLANLYWNMKLLSNPSVPPLGAEWRFLYRWLMDWGLAPELLRCSHCGRAPEPGQTMAWTDDGLICSGCNAAVQEERPSFTRAELGLLAHAAGHGVEDTVKLFSEHETLRNQDGVFTLSSRCAESILISNT